MQPLDRTSFNEAVTYMVTSVSPYHKEYVFYAHMISQCRLVSDPELKAPCAVNFQNDHYNLYINFDIFKELTLEQRMGKLKEEMLHILYSHVNRSKGRNAKKFDYAADCAVNQHINPAHLTDDVTMPNRFPSSTGTVPPGMTAEQYYEMVDLSDDPDGDPNGDGDGSGEGNSEARNSHSKWEESQGNEVVQKDITKQMAQKSQAQAQKARGDTPSQYSDWMDLLTSKKEVDWRKVLRRIIGNKKANTKKTLMRPDRRNPELAHIKGRTKNRTFDLAVVSDVSGSVSDKALTTMWGEVVNACKLKNVPATLVQVDSEAHPPQPLTHKTRQLERKASGGTMLSPAIKMLADHKIKYDAMIVSTDGYLCESDVEAFHKLNKRILWLIEKDGEIMPSMNRGKMQAVKLKE